MQLLVDDQHVPCIVEGIVLGPLWKQRQGSKLPRNSLARIKLGAYEQVGG